MMKLFTQSAKIFNRVFTPDNAGGETADFIEADNVWRVRITPMRGEYAENAPGREYPERIRLVGEIRDDLKRCDRIEFNDKHWELISLLKVDGVGSIPDYFRAEAILVPDMEV
ncbi:hypothetical protein J7L05_10170 [bacterium]|nr:hypothetical protein [bacterium]